MKFLCSFIIILFSLSAKMNAGSSYIVHSMDTDTLPYYQIPDYPEEYNQGAIVSRMVDGLGYRYYWATEGLREEDLNHKPSEDARSCFETLQHLYYLSRTVKNISAGLPNIRSSEADDMDYETLRKATLENILEGSKNFIQIGNENIGSYKIIFQRDEKTSEYEFWHMLNGPLADAIYHVGQIVTFRRSSGNPLNPTVNVFRGKNRE